MFPFSTPRQLVVGIKRLSPRGCRAAGPPLCAVRASLACAGLRSRLIGPPVRCSASAWVRGLASALCHPPTLVWLSCGLAVPLWGARSRLAARGPSGRIARPDVRGPHSVALARSGSPRPGCLGSCSLPGGGGLCRGPFWEGLALGPSEPLNPSTGCAERSARARAFSSQLGVHRKPAIGA